MKLAIFAVFIIGISFAGSVEVGDLLLGGVTLLPALTHAGDGFEHFGEGMTAFGLSLEETTNCSTSGSNQNSQKLAEDTKKLANDISNFAAANVQETNNAGQLAILTGNLYQVTYTGYVIGDGLNTATEQLYIVSDDVPINGLSDIDELNSAYENIAQALVEFNASFRNFTGLSKLGLNTLTGLTGIDKGVHIGLAGVKYALKSAEDYDAKCNVSSGLPKSLGHVLEEGDKTANYLKLLNLSSKD